MAKLLETLQNNTQPSTAVVFSNASLFSYKNKLAQGKAPSASQYEDQYQKVMNELATLNEMKQMQAAKAEHQDQYTQVMQEVRRLAPVPVGTGKDPEKELEQRRTMTPRLSMNGPKR